MFLCPSLPSRERGLKFRRTNYKMAWRTSLPSRERGLKFENENISFDDLQMSLPSRERGLKYAGHAVVGSRGASLPSRERGLKYLASYSLFPSLTVAPLAGAWIEIMHQYLISCNLLSLPSRERGLKSKWFLLFSTAVRRSPRGSVD